MGKTDYFVYEKNESRNHFNFLYFVQKKIFSDRNHELTKNQHMRMPRNFLMLFSQVEIALKIVTFLSNYNQNLIIRHFVEGYFVEGYFVEGDFVWRDFVGGILSRGILSRGILSGGFCRGGFCRGDFVWGDFVGGILSRGILSGGFCLGGFCRGAFVGGILSRGILSGGGGGDYVGPPVENAMIFFIHITYYNQHH